VRARKRDYKLTAFTYAHLETPDEYFPYIIWERRR